MQPSPPGAPGPYTLLVDEEFVRDVHARLEDARDRVYVQFMTFEADGAGLPLAQRLIDAAQRGVDVRVIVDTYSDFFVSDAYHLRREVRDEARATQRMFREMEAAGVELVRTRPFGPLHALLLFRNHKKMVVVDDVCYLGGINASDHNLAWHDLMVRFDAPPVAEAAVDLVQRTLAGREPHLVLPCGLVTNDEVPRVFDALLREAQERVVLSSPYMAGMDLVRRLRAVDEGVDVLLLTSAQNNLRVFEPINRYVYTRLAEQGVRVCLYEDFSHAKFLLVDGRTTFLGSSNFGQESFLYKDEVNVVVRDRDFARTLHDRLVEQKRDVLAPFKPADDPASRWASGAFSHLADWSMRLYHPLARPFTRVLAE